MAELHMSTPFNAFDVCTWSSYIDQDDPRMISYDLRVELERAYEVYPYSAKCRQAVLRSVVLWATMSRTQRQVIAWDNDMNLRLGQALVQHMLDLTAELKGVNTDEIYAALQAEQHPFLKKMHEIEQSRKTHEGEWSGRHDRAAAAITEATRSTTTYALSPLPLGEVSQRMPQRAPTVMAPSLAREESLAAAASEPAILQTVDAETPPPAYTSPGAENGRFSKAVTKAMGSKETAQPPKPAAAATAEPTTRPVKVVAAAPAVESKTAAARPPPPPFVAAVNATKANGHAAPPPPFSKKKEESERTPGVSLRPRPPPPPPAQPAAPAAPKNPAPLVQAEKEFVYSDSEEFLSSRSSSAASAPAPKTAAVAVAAKMAEPPPSVPSRGATALATEAELLKYGHDGTENLLQACLDEMPADPDGVSAWTELKLAVTEKDRKKRLLAEAPPPLLLDNIKSRMEVRVVKRLDQLFQYLYADAPLELLPHNEAAAFLSAADIAQLADVGLIRPSKRPAGPDTVIAFSVMDGTEQETTRRFLSWPCGSNRNAMDDAYDPKVSLHHISTYLNAVNAPAGCAESLAACFDQILLPTDMQERFVFTDATSKRWCLTRLPMTHIVAAEIVQILLCTLCGHPSYTLPKFAADSAVLVDVWVRHVRFYGAQKGVQQSRDKFRAACKECSVALQLNKGGGGGVYTFIGVHFDHTAHTVCVEPELLRRIAAPRRLLNTRDLERQYTQLLFSAAVLHIAVSKFYTLARTVYWRLSQTFAEVELLLKPELLPQDSFAHLEKWHKDALHNAPRSVAKVALPNMTLFVELSLESWFAVLIGEETQETWTSYGSLEDMLGTKIACASITRAIEQFQECIEKGAHVTILIIGGKSLGRNDTPIFKNESKDVIADCIRTHLVTRTFSFEVRYLGLEASKANGSAAAGQKPAAKEQRKEYAR
ncbi:hypothetical protein ABB37_02418 [Leptomonas pyrrhocoris]|uniref:Uncharacterized protein n=1 Tax=Leptomonas pyrrhocoris TaxID=157538 RepID=A0A0N0VGV5_LEPPY|nr:hypothetical protein ABB37_02418 [Leptomonas pyrrhocoris]XP_015662894.1 hypothetical protein ABB37_02418 [Leptomonas pyrrhocoris]XP_015662895.1 hypothetical protein ABB37_02418 [Leptomonas pyrrhocoris]KPA84454.1 hypothetical protein ABB37_02418 [Leptomonas pyrrhocoris]KPA84455.1 hypothetical protein ABB37_02418 [Leptomonas pyrrhocoris]KPA84456.1 hypothetical protein ABB37_02418 [Leptomonas pyrrhocoris]|eukprot:XP_015662893.1 hypothetical protein ABB37_02418 [Leptomonas pyrrhocoris]